MDASPSASGNSFDAALKALEDLDTAAAPSREEMPAANAAPAIEPVSAIGFSDSEEVDGAVAIDAVPAAEQGEAPAEPPLSAEVLEHLLQSAGFPATKADATAAVDHSAARPSALDRFGKVVVGLALFSSIVSAAGLVVAERTIMSARLVVADARERQQQLEHANKLIGDLRLVRDKQIELLRAQQAQLAATPVTSAELQHRMEALQSALLARDPLNNVVSAIREGQADTNARFNEFGMKIARLEAAAGGQH